MPLKFGGGPKCKACGKTVYKAEEVISEAGIYHKLCFRCSVCRKLLDSFSLTVHDETLFCKSCYGKNFGPKGYGFGGGGAGMMQSEAPPVQKPLTTTVQPNGVPAENQPPPKPTPVTTTAPKNRSFKENFRPGNDRCPRCNGRVYYAEKVVANRVVQLL